MDGDDDGSPSRPESGVVSPGTEAVQSRWERVITDLEATAGEYRELGWEILEIHPGDVAALDPGRSHRWGLELLLPDDEFRRLETWVGEEGGSFDSCEVLRGSGGGILFLVVAMFDVETDRAVLFPAYYDPAGASSMLEAAESAGEIRAHLRPLTGEPVVTFTIDDPGLVFPPDWREPSGE